MNHLFAMSDELMTTHSLLIFIAMTLTSEFLKFKELCVNYREGKKQKFLLFSYSGEDLIDM